MPRGPSGLGLRQLSAAVRDGCRASGLGGAGVLLLTVPEPLL